jgi:hypothetical protein
MAGMERHGSVLLLSLMVSYGCAPTDADLPLGAHEIRGTVVCSNGSPAHPAFVAAYDAPSYRCTYDGCEGTSATLLGQTETDEDGGFRLTFTPPEDPGAQPSLEAQGVDFVCGNGYNSVMIPLPARRDNVSLKITPYMI